MSPISEDATQPDERPEDLRPLLFSIAYRMLGSVAEAEDVVQEAYLRHERALADGVEVRSPRAWLSAVTTRLAIDHLRSARVRREAYVGPWLPEPLVADDAPGPDERVELADELSLAFLVVLERLSPVERAVFLLREAFGYDYHEIAALVDRTPENCRQLAVRARRHVEAERPRFPVSREHHEELTDRFMRACESGDSEALVGMLAADAVAYTDGGGKVRASPRPIAGADAVARFLVATVRRGADLYGYSVRTADVNGRPGRVLYDRDGAVISVLSLDVDEDRIHSVHVVVNPDKLRHIAPAAR
jgi:RNA polymerase sigma-70 factor, ECF subfamily